MSHRKVTKTCPHAASCFECPLPDCRIDVPGSVNEILSSELYLELLSDRGAEETKTPPG